MSLMVSNYIPYIDPFATEDDVEESYMVNEYDLFIKFKDGRKYMYDTFRDTFCGFYPSGHILSDDEWHVGFRKRLRKMLERKGMTQEELADCLNVSRVTINRYINGQTVPSGLMLKKISLLLNCDINDFFYKEY